MILRTKQAEAGGQVKNHWPNLTYYPSISLGRLRKTTIKFSQDSWSAVSWTQSRTANHLTTTVYILPSDTTQPSHFNFSYHLLLIPSVAHTVCHLYHLSHILSVTHTSLALACCCTADKSPCQWHTHNSADSAIQSSCTLPLPSLAPTISPGSDTWHVPMPAPPPADSPSHHISSL